MTHIPFSQVFQQDIAFSALDLNISILPMELSRKMPFKGFKWNNPSNWIGSVENLISLYKRYPSPAWDPKKTEASEVFRFAIRLMELVIIDVDFQKLNKIPCGWPLLGPVKQEWLDQAVHKQKTASTYKGQHTYHYFFKKHGRCYQLPKTRLEGTTIDVLTGNKLLLLYEKLPVKEVWDKLSYIPEQLFNCLLDLYRVNLKTRMKEGVWMPGNRNMIFKDEVYYSLKDRDFMRLAKSLSLAKKSGYPFNQAMSVIRSTHRNHFNNLTLNYNSLERIYYA